MSWTRKTSRGDAYFERQIAGRPGVVERVSAEAFERSGAAEAVEGFALGRFAGDVGGERSRSSASRPRATPRAEKKPRARDTIDHVFLTLWGQRQLAEQLDTTDPLVERGGGLFGYVDEDSRTIVIDDVTGRVADATESHGLLDVSFIDRMAARHAATTRGYRTVGTWHSHGKLGQTDPSRADERSFAAWFERGGEQPFVGVILARTDATGLSWAEPKMVAHAVTRGSGGGTILKPMPVILEPGDPWK